MGFYTLERLVLLIRVANIFPICISTFQSLQNVLFCPFQDMPISYSGQPFSCHYRLVLPILEYHINGIILCIFSYIWLPLTYIILLRFIHLVVCINRLLFYVLLLLSLIAQLYSIVWIDQNLFIHSLIDRYLASFQIVIIINKGSMNIDAEILLCMYLFIYFR